MDLLEQIKDLIDQGKTLKEIARILNQNYSEIKKRIEELNSSNILKDQKEYKRYPYILYIEPNILVSSILPVKMSPDKPFGTVLSKRPCYKLRKCQQNNNSKK